MANARMSNLRPQALEVEEPSLNLPGVGRRRRSYSNVALSDPATDLATLEGSIDGEKLEFTFRAVVVGLCVGILLCFTNMYFGLQTGWVTMGSVQAAVVGFGVCKLIFPKDSPLTRLENVLLQTVSVATATMPLTAGFVGIIPALAMLDPPVRLTGSQQMLWCTALSYFGIFFTVPLRRQTILVEELPFPSGTATANLINLLHGKADSEGLMVQWRLLRLSFATSFLIAFVGFFWPKAANLTVGTWIGLPMLTTWHWTLRPSLSYVGQGMIMGPRPVFSMLLGAVVAWAILGPTSRAVGWAPGPVDSWSDGAQGWVLWVAIGLMLGEALTTFVLSFYKEMDIVLEVMTPKSHHRHSQLGVDVFEVAPESDLVPRSWWLSGLVLALAACTAIVSPLFAIPLWQTFLAALLGCLISVIAVRALGQTDLNPVSGVGKLSQLIFAVVAPGQIVTNIVAGAVVEAGAMQAGDMMQALKTGHLVRSSPKAQFWGQLIGSTASVFVTVGAYQMYDHIYGIPSAQFGAPVAHVWVKMAWFMKVGVDALPSSALVCAGISGSIGVMLPLVEYHGEKFRSDFSDFTPSGVAVGIGMYLTPDWTLPRVWGTLACMMWRRIDKKSHDDSYVMVASGFVLGEVVMSLLALLLKSLNVPTF